MHNFHTDSKNQTIYCKTRCTQQHLPEVQEQIVPKMHTGDRIIPIFVNENIWGEDSHLILCSKKVGQKKNGSNNITPTRSTHLQIQRKFLHFMQRNRNGIHSSTEGNGVIACRAYT